jgi:hypothetical protein
MAEETGRRFAERHPEWTVVQLPPLTLGADELPLRGSLEAPPSTLYRVLLAHGRGLARAGYGAVVVTNGHGGPRHAAALEAACRRVSKRRGIRMFTPSALTLHRIVTGKRFERVEQLIGRSLDERERRGLLSGEHAAGWETSFMLAERPELVEPGYRSLPPLRPPTWKPLDRLGRSLADSWERLGGDAAKLREAVDALAGGIGWLLNARYGYGGDEVSYKGDPGVASVEVGRAFREILAADCLEVVEAVCRGDVRPEEVRSIASEHAVIQPGFLVKLAAAAALAIAALQRL